MMIKIVDRVDEVMVLEQKMKSVMMVMDKVKMVDQAIVVGLKTTLFD